MIDLVAMMLLLLPMMMMMMIDLRDLAAAKAAAAPPSPPCQQQILPDNILSGHRNLNRWSLGWSIWAVTKLGLASSEKSGSLQREGLLISASLEGPLIFANLDLGLADQGPKAS